MNSKSLFLIAAFQLALVSIGFSQTYFSCYYRQICEWNDFTEDFDICEGYDEQSMFKMNAEETMFIHTTETIRSSYYINSTEYDTERELWVYDVTSDVGNNYMYIFDPNNDEIRVLIFAEDGSSSLIRFYVKSMWTE